MQEPSLSQLALTMLTIDFMRYALAAGVVWLLVELVFGRRLAGRRILDGVRQPPSSGAPDRNSAVTLR